MAMHFIWQALFSSQWMKMPSNVTATLQSQQKQGNCKVWEDAEKTQARSHTVKQPLF